MTIADSPERGSILQRLGAAMLALVLPLGGCMTAAETGAEPGLTPGALAAFRLPGTEPAPKTVVIGSVTRRPEDGSLALNGREVGLAAETSVEDAFGAARLADIEVGTVVEITASSGPGGLNAEQIRIVHPLVGPVTAIDPEARLAEVMGAPVRLPGTGRLDARVGARVAVEGIWRDGHVVATRLRPRPALRPTGGTEPDAVSGILRTGPDGGPMIGPVALLLWEEATAPPDGSYVRAYGGPAEDGFEVLRLEVGQFVGIRAGRLIIEAYPEPAVSATDTRRLSGLAMAVIAPALPASRQLLAGPVVNGVFQPEHALPLPDRPGPRRILLDGEFPLAQRLGAINIATLAPAPPVEGE